MFHTKEIYNATGLMDLIREVGFLPMFDCGIEGFCAEEVVSDDCRYVTFADGGWDWPLWKWKGPIVTDMPCIYGKFFNNKAGFISKQWWPDFCNYRTNKYSKPEDGTIEAMILSNLQEMGSAITRELRAACGFDGKGMRSKFDGYVTKLEMSCRIITEDFVYPRDRHGKEYGWGWSLLTTPEQLHGKECCYCERTPEETFQLLFNHFKTILPDATVKQILKLL